MNLDFSPEEIAFREEVRAFIKDNYPAHLGDIEGRDKMKREDFLAWHKILAKKGWAAPAWPVEYGGTGWTSTQRYIWSEENALAETIPPLPFGVSMVGPVIYTFGTPEQKAKYHRGGAGSMYAIVFDFDTNTLQETYPNEHWRNADTEVRNYLVARGFEWRQGSTYFGDQTVDAVRCVRVVQKLAAKYPWFTPSARDIRMLRIEENNDPMSALDDQDDD